MKRLFLGIPGSGKIPYFRRVLSTRPGNLILYHPHWEPSGSVATDLSQQGNNGAYTGVTLGATGIGDGRTAATYDGSTSFNNIYSAGLVADFSGAAGTLAAWAKLSGAGIWTDGNQHDVIRIQVDTDNYVLFGKADTDNRFRFLYKAGGTAETINADGYSGLDWYHLAVTYDAATDEFIAYINGTQVGSTQTGLGTWAGALESTQCVVGAQSTVPAGVWDGDLGPVMGYNVALVANEIANLARV